jgi:hypothetical protein
MEEDKNKIVQSNLQKKSEKRTSFLDLVFSLIERLFSLFSFFSFSSFSSQLAYDPFKGFSYNGHVGFVLIFLVMLATHSVEGNQPNYLRILTYVTCKIISFFS